MDPELFIRQTNLANPDLLQMRILVVGAGGIGSWTTLALLKMGCSNVTVMDFDRVEVHNSSSQVYGSWDDGKPKVVALQDHLRTLTQIIPKIVEASITEDNAQDILSEFDIIISAVDSIDVRKLLFNSLYGSQKHFIDGRMAGNAIEIYSIPMNDEEKTKIYRETLFTEEEAIHIECSSRAVIYNCFVISGLITDIVARIAHEDETPTELIVDLMNFTMFN